MVGHNADVSSSALSNATAIGYNAKVSASNSLVLGGTGADAVNVGIGVTAPATTLHVKGVSNFFSNGNTRTGSFWNGTSSSDGMEIWTGGTDAYVGIQRATATNLWLGKTGSGGLITFYVSGTNVGSITTNSTTTTYNTTSDLRLKENITQTKYGLDTLMKMEVKDYFFKADKNKSLQTGFIAQELYKIFPQAVTVGGDDVKNNPWMVDYSRLTPILVRSVQEQQKIIEEQNKKIESYEEKIKAMDEKLNTLIKKMGASEHP